MRRHSRFPELFFCDVGAVGVSFIPRLFLCSCSDMAYAGIHADKHVYVVMGSGSVKMHSALIFLFSYAGCTSVTANYVAQDARNNLFRVGRMRRRKKIKFIKIIRRFFLEVISQIVKLLSSWRSSVRPESVFMVPVKENVAITLRYNTLINFYSMCGGGCWTTLNPPCKYAVKELRLWVIITGAVQLG